MKRFVKFYLLLLIFISTNVFIGCAKYGPAFLKSERSLYNQAIQRTNDEQLILNLVRLKYHDTPLFMEVSHVASRFTLQSDIGITAKLQDGAKGIFTPEASTFIEERPTVSYSPLQGESFVQSVLTNVPLKTVALLFHSGWSIDRIFKICLQRIGKLKNAPGASGPTPKIAPDTNEFFKAVKHLRTLQIKGAIYLVYRETNKEPYLVLKIIEKFKNSKSANQFAQAINAAPGKTSYTFSFPSLNKSKSTEIVTRSLLGIMFYLSQGVEVPEQDRKEGKVTLTKTAAGDLFDWKEITGELLNIRFSVDPPKDARLLIYYRKYWFFITDYDLASKSTFSLLSQVYALQAGNLK